MLLVSMLLEKQSVQAGVEAQPWEKGVEKDVEKTKTDKTSSLKSLSSASVHGHGWSHFCHSTESETPLTANLALGRDIWNRIWKQ